MVWFCPSCQEMGTPFVPFAHTPKDCHVRGMTEFLPLCYYLALVLCVSPGQSKSGCFALSPSAWQADEHHAGAPLHLSDCGLLFFLRLIKVVVLSCLGL